MTHYLHFTMGPTGTGYSSNFLTNGKRTYGRDAVTVNVVLRKMSSRQNCFLSRGEKSSVSVARYTQGRTGSPGPGPDLDPSSAPAPGRNTQPGARVAFSEGSTLTRDGGGDRPMGSKGPTLASGPQRRPEQQERPSPRDPETSGYGTCGDEARLAPASDPRPG